jgi:hypothetical protein
LRPGILCFVYGAELRATRQAPNGRIVRYEYNSGLDTSISRLS